MPGPRSNQLPVAPGGARDQIEEQILATWCFVLQRPRIEPDEHFFKLGGTSLDALDVAWRLDEIFGVKLPLDAFAEAPTVAQQAQRIRERLVDRGWRPVVRLRQGEDRPPFFCVHPIDGNVLCYTDLAGNMEEGQPFYGIQAKGLDGIEEPHRDFPDMAEDYAAAIRSVQKRGPYYLGGWSAGGIVALEVAQRLQAAGQTVALLVLLDTVFPARRLGRIAWFERLLGADRSEELREFEQYILDSPQEAPAEYAVAHTLHALYMDAVADYRPERYEGRITLLIPEAQLRRTHDAIERVQAEQRKGPFGRVRKRLRTLARVERTSPLNWRLVARDGLEMHSLPGDHGSMIRGENAVVCAARISECMRRAATG